MRANLRTLLCVRVSHSITSNFLWPHALWPVQFLYPWNYPGKNTEVGSHSLLQGIFPTQGSNLGLLHCMQILHHLRHQGSPRTLLEILKKLPRWHRGRFNLWVRKVPWQPTPGFLPEKFHGQRSLVGCSPWGHKELDTTEQLNTRTPAAEVKAVGDRPVSAITSETVCLRKKPAQKIVESRLLDSWY